MHGEAQWSLISGDPPPQCGGVVGSKAQVYSSADVCFWVNSGHRGFRPTCLLLTQSGHRRAVFAQCAADASLQDLLYFAAILGIGVTHEAATVH